MQKRHRVAPGRRFTYPADPVSLRAIRDAGGVSQLTEEAKAKLRFKTVEGGQNCDDMPEPALSIYIQRGCVLIDETKPALEEDGES